MNTLYFLLLLYACCIYIGSATLLIRQLGGPNWIKNGSTDEMILDCDYEASSAENRIVVKWFYNSDNYQIYQWIPESGNHGFASGKFKNLIDLSYKVSNDKNTMYRALRITNVTSDMSGNFTCKVSSDENEVKATKQLVIYTPPEQDLELVLFEDLSQVLCTAGGAFPKPVISMYALSGNDTVDYVVDEQEDVFENGLYNVTSILTYATTNVTETLRFICELHIPGTNFSLAKQTELLIGDFGNVYPTEFEEEQNITNEVLINGTIFEKENSGTQNCYTLMLIITALLFLSMFTK